MVLMLKFVLALVCFAEEMTTLFLMLKFVLALVCFAEEMTTLMRFLSPSPVHDNRLFVLSF